LDEEHLDEEHLDEEHLDEEHLDEEHLDEQQQSLGLLTCKFVDDVSAKRKLNHQSSHGQVTSHAN
jgi:hypothetical protein